MHVADLRKELCESESGSFSDPQLSEESMSIVETFRALNVGDESRPAKRQKTLADDITQRPVPSLSSLRKIIQFSCSLLSSWLTLTILGLNTLRCRTTSKRANVYRYIG
jgi:hypothetical protein